MCTLVRSHISLSVPVTMLGAWIALSTFAPAFANVITDWDEKGVAVVVPSLGGASPYPPQRMMGMVHAAMFDAVNSIERRYRPYLVQLPADPATSKEAAAAAAAATVLATIDAKTAGEMKAALATYLALIPDGAAKSDGVKLGEAVAAKVLEARANDGSEAPDAYRPVTTPGVYVPTAITLSSMWPNMKPFAIANPSQFRPDPPISLEGKEWATDFNELKDYGGQISAKRTAQQTETARFWLVGPPAAYHPFVRQLVTAKQMSVVDSARFMALVAVAERRSAAAVAAAAADMAVEDMAVADIAPISGSRPILSRSRGSTAASASTASATRGLTTRLTSASWPRRSRTSSRAPSPAIATGICASTTTSLGWSS